MNDIKAYGALKLLSTHRRFVFITALSAIVIIVFAAIWLESYQRVAWLSEITGLEPSQISDITRTAEWGILFGDTIFAWHMNVGDFQNKVFSNATPSYESDYKFAATELKSMLPEVNDIPEEGVVYRKSVGLAKLYYIAGENKGSLYIMEMHR